MPRESRIQQGTCIASGEAVNIEGSLKKSKPSKGVEGVWDNSRKGGGSGN